MAILRALLGLLFFCALAVLFFGIFPNEGILPLPLHDWAGASAAGLFVP